MTTTDAADNETEQPNLQRGFVDHTTNARSWLEAVDEEAWQMNRDLGAGLYEESIEGTIMWKHMDDNPDEDFIITEEELREEYERRHNWLDNLQAHWAGPDRGFHVEFNADEVLPLKEGMMIFLSIQFRAYVVIDRYLGRGAMGDVYETTLKDHSLAWKRIPLKRKIGPKDMKEIEILKKLSHAHMIKLVGTYTHRQSLGLLLYPVATCDLHTFFNDVEALWSNTADESQKKRLEDINYRGQPSCSMKASTIYLQIGCLVSAIAYLHAQKIRHKDLKPSNILLLSGGLYLSDFGSATDFSLLSQSTTDNERGTPKYFAPEVGTRFPRHAHRN